MKNLEHFFTGPHFGAIVIIILGAIFLWLTVRLSFNKVSGKEKLQSYAIFAFVLLLSITFLSCGTSMIFPEYPLQYIIPAYLLLYAIIYVIAHVISVKRLRTA
jgi:hypothetical protein